MGVRVGTEPVLTRDRAGTLHAFSNVCRHRGFECQWPFGPRGAEAARLHPAYAVDFWDLTNRQDWAVCEGVQRGVWGLGYRQGPLADAEREVAAFVRFLAEGYLTGRLAGATPATRDGSGAGPGSARPPALRW